jgi:cold shock protein
VSRTDATVTTGVVKWFDPDRGYGIITTADYRDVFAHISQLSDECDDPEKGDRVNFLEDMGKDGRAFARRIVVLK